MSSVLRFVAIALLAPAAALAYPYGVVNQASAGCGGNSCHSSAPTPAIRVCIEGLPPGGSYAPGQPYDLNVFVDGVSLPPSNGIVTADSAVAGFNLATSAGVLGKALDDDTTRFPLEGEGATSLNQLTHTVSGRLTNHWNATWTAPGAGAGAATLWLSGNAVNGNGVADTGDLWNRVTVTLVAGTGTGVGTGIYCAPPLPLPQLLPLPLPVH